MLMRGMTECSRRPKMVKSLLMRELRLNATLRLGRMAHTGGEGTRKDRSAINPFSSPGLHKLNLDRPDTSQELFATELGKGEADWIIPVPGDGSGHCISDDQSISHLSAPPFTRLGGGELDRKRIAPKQIIT